jgi:sn-glycerol 3-phosphate transport system substrate-binding protein
MKKMKAKASLSISIILVMLFVQGCGTSTKSLNTAATQPTKETTATSASSAPITITWWHAMSGDGGKAIDQIVSDYNASKRALPGYGKRRQYPLHD